jgi:hypothetical protein
MSEEDKPKFQAGATIQIDLDQVQLVDLDAHPSSPAMSRMTPPPLPQEAPAPQEAALRASRASAAPVAAAPAASRGRNLLYMGLIGVVVLLAIAAGLVVGKRVRGSAATTAPSAVVPSATHAAPVDSVLTIPPIEVR